ncbi:MAG: hypothetical protein ABI395_08405, partial [Sphingobium sp.]
SAAPMVHQEQSQGRDSPSPKILVDLFHRSGNMQQSARTCVMICIAQLLACRAAAIGESQHAE